jgi:hypothetical protein
VREIASLAVMVMPLTFWAGGAGRIPDIFGLRPLSRRFLGHSLPRAYG